MSELREWRGKGRGPGLHKTCACLNALHGVPGVWGGWVRITKKKRSITKRDAELIVAVLEKVTVSSVAAVGHRAPSVLWNIQGRERKSPPRSAVFPSEGAAERDRDPWKPQSLGLLSTP